MLNIGKTDIYKIIVNPYENLTWEGLFDFRPNADDVATAIQQDISELDPQDEDDFDIIQSWKETLELVTFTGPELLGEVSIAGTYVGEISIARIKVFRQNSVDQSLISRNPRQ